MYYEALARYLRGAAITAFASLAALGVGMLLQMQKGNIDNAIIAQQFDRLMRMYYLGADVKAIAEVVLLSSLIVGGIAGILDVLCRALKRKR